MKGLASHGVALNVTVLRILLAIFALLNAAFWAALAAAWSWRPDWPAHLPLRFTAPMRRPEYLKAASTWARLSGSLAGFWIAAAGLYAIGEPSANKGAVIVLFVIASIFLIIGIIAGGAVFRTLGFRGSAPATQNREHSL